MTTSAQRADTLRADIRRHDNLYYNLNRPEISDQDYDSLFSELKGIEASSAHPPPPDSPTQRVAGAVSSSFQSVHHQPAMLSLGNAADVTQFRGWHDRTNRALNYSGFNMTAELKIDGLAISIDYLDGDLVTAATRGDGQTGEDVSHNVRTIRNLPLRLLAPPPGLLQVRAEAYLPLESFREINEQRRESGEYLYSNPRNAAAGSVRQLDPSVASQRNLRAWVYSLNQADPAVLHSHWERLDMLARAGLPINPHRTHTDSLQDIIDYYQQMLDMRPHLEYETDGIVVKVDALPIQQRLGATSHEPRAQMGHCVEVPVPPGHHPSPFHIDQPRQVRQTHARRRTGARHHRRHHHPTRLPPQRSRHPPQGYPRRRGRAHRACRRRHSASRGPHRHQSRPTRSALSHAGLLSGMRISHQP